MGRLIKDGTFFGTATSHRRVAGVTLTESRYAPHQRIPPHAHRLPYMCVVMGGEFEEAGAGWRERCGPGTLVFHPTGEEHADLIGPAGARCFNLQVGPVLNGRLESQAALPQHREALPPGPAAALAVALRTALRLGPALTALAVEDALLAVLAQLSGEGGTLRRPGRVPPWLSRAIERLRAADPPPVTVLAAEAGVHPVYFTRAFRAATRMGPCRFALRTRLERASSALIVSNASVSTIAHEAGFADHSHFCRHFRRIFGVTPSAYRTGFR